MDPTRPDTPTRAEFLRPDAHPPGVEESFVSLMLEHAMDGMCLIRDDGTILATTPGIDRMLGLEPGSMVGTFGLERVHPDDQHAAVEALAGLASGVEDDGEYEVFRFRHEDGHWVVVELITNAQPMDHPGVAGTFVVTVRDVSEVHVARLALVQSRKRRELLASVAARFVDALDSEIDEAVEDALAAMIRHTGADRASIVRLADDGESAIRTHGATRPGSRFFVDTGVPLPIGSFTGWRDLIVGQQGVLVDAEHPIGPGYDGERVALGDPRPTDGAILAVPLVRAATVIGYLGLDVLGRSHVWHEDDGELVRVAADVIGSALARRDAAEETRLTESRFRALVQNSGDALIVIDEHAVISHMPLGTRLFGYTPEQLFGMNTLDLVHPDDQDFAATEMIRAVTEPDYVATNAMRIRHADGHWVPIELMASSHFDDPAINGVVMNVRDHTERDAYAAALRTSEERHRTLIANLPGAVYRCRATPPYEDEFVSEMIEALTGYTVAEFLANTVVFDDLILPDHRARTDLELDAAVAARRSYIIEYPIQHRDGTVRWLSEHGQIIHDDDGEPEFLEGFMFDVTSRVEAVNETRESETKLANLIDNVPGAVFRCEIDPPYRDVFISDAIEDLTGYAADTFCENELELYDLIAPEHRDRIDAEIAHHVSLGEPYLIEYQIVHRDGGRRWVEERGQAIEDEGGTPRWLDGVLMDLTVRKALEEQLAHDAAHDPLTGLPNRTLLVDHLEATLARAERAGTHTAVLFVDLDRFKLVNDAMGHTAGDELLVHFTRRLNSVLRDSDLAGRTGGDEFVIVCTDLESPVEAEAIAGRVADVLGDPFTVQGRTVFVTASIGIALAEAGALAGDVLRSADAAAYRAKDRGRNRYEVFDDALRAATTAALEIETDLHRALERHQLFLRYQPVVELTTGRLIGAEALVRWQHPQRGLLTPDQFLPAAEASGLVVAIGREMLDLAAGALAAVPVEALPSINVNVSPRELAQRDLVDRIREVLGTNDVDPRRLCIEITENAVLDELDAAIETLDAIRALGVRLAIDDFGTGYSSLSYLRRLPVDTVKIDRTFTTELNTDSNDVTIVAGIIGLARGLGLQVVAEGVETERQAEILVELGCAQAQGFLYSPPVALDDLLRLRNHHVVEPRDARH